MHQFVQWTRRFLPHHLPRPSTALRRLARQRSLSLRPSSHNNRNQDGSIGVVCLLQVGLAPLRNLAPILIFIAGKLLRLRKVKTILFASRPALSQSLQSASVGCTFLNIEKSRSGFYIFLPAFLSNSSLNHGLRHRISRKCASFFGAFCLTPPSTQMTIINKTTTCCLQY